MAMDLDLIKQTIDSQKKEQKVLSEQAGHIPADQFLSELKKSLMTGEPTVASTKVKVVNERSQNMDVSSGQVINKNTTPAPQIAPQQQPQQPQYNNPNPYAQYQQGIQQPQQPQQPQGQQVDAREEQFYRNLQETKQILGANGMPTQNAGMADALSMYQNQNPNQQQMITNPNFLTEQVKNEVTKFMSNIDLTALVEHAVKNTMMEMYQKEKVSAALNENEDLIEKMVIDTIMKIKKQNSKQSPK